MCADMRYEGASKKNKIEYQERFKRMQLVYEHAHNSKARRISQRKVCNLHAEKLSTENAPTNQQSSVRKNR